MNGRTTLWIPQSAIAAIEEEASRHAPKETGGILLGRWDETGAVIAHVIGPGPQALHLRHAFIPDYEYQEFRIVQLYTETAKMLEYLGDWHTHPMGHAYLSRKDRRTIKRIASYSLARCPNPIMLILSPGPIWHASAWVGRIAKYRCFTRLSTTPMLVSNY